MNESLSSHNELSLEQQNWSPFLYLSDFILNMAPYIEGHDND